MRGDTDLLEPSLVNDGIGNIGETGTEWRNHLGQMGGTRLEQCFHQLEEFTPVENQEAEAVQCANLIGGLQGVQIHLILILRQKEEQILG